VRMGTAEPVDLVGLARAAGEGDEASRDTLMAAARPLMLRWAARLVDDPAVHEDVVQDALIEVHRTLVGLRARSRSRLAALGRAQARRPAPPPTSTGTAPGRGRR